MHKLVLGVALVPFGLASACATESQPAIATTECPQALVASQGLSVQGMSTQGMAMQGINVQGMTAQGINVQGFNIQGMNLNGLSPGGVNGVSAQGFSFNGLTAQGMSYNGLSPYGGNGVSAQGLSVQGLTPQGASPQGVSAQGFSGQGMQIQGLTVQGLQPQGVQPQGVSVQGFSGQGIQVQGFTPQGLTQQGVTVQGVTAQGRGLSGLALRGVNEEEATRWVEGLQALDTDQVVFIGIDEGVLSGRTAAGEELHDAALVGLLLPFLTSRGEGLWIAITGVSQHPSDEKLPLYALAIGGESLCADPQGGMFVPGIWDETGAFHESVATGDQSIDTTFSCTAGVIAKCVGWGYKPWAVGSDLHAACTRMARADYCGDGVPHTENGTLIDMYDTRGIQTPVGAEGLTFEAGWNKDGAVCVRSPRYVDSTTTGVPIRPSCWSDKPHCESFEEAVALGAELGNDSGHTPRSFECGY